MSGTTIIKASMVYRTLLGNSQYVAYSFDTTKKNVRILKNVNTFLNFRGQNQSNKVNEAQKNGARAVNMGISKPTSTGSTVRSNNSTGGSTSEYSTPKPPSEEFLKWCRQALRGLNNVNGILSMN